MATDRQRMEKFQGVYYRDHSTRRHGGKPDRCFDISFKTPSGKKVWEKVGWASEGYTAQVASQVRAERVRTIRHGEELPNRKANVLTFGDLWGKYAEWAKLNTKAFNREENRYRKHLEQDLKSMPLVDITPAFLEEKVKLEMQKKGYAPATVKHVLTLARTVINRGLSLGLWNGPNPVKQVNLPKLNNKRERFLTQAEAENLLEALGKISRQWRDIALLSLHTGLRAGEVFGLRCSHVNLEDGIISLLDTKSGTSQKAFMTKTANAMLTTYTEGKGQDAYVFTARRGKHRGEQITEVSDTFKRVVNLLGLNDGITDDRQKVCFHTLRHTFASWLALDGIPVLTIKELMRHASLTMTERYSHLIPDHKRQAINVIETKWIRQSSSSGSE
jgi:integrase